MFARLLTKASTFGTESTARKILYGMIDSYNNNHKADDKLSYEIKNYNALLKSLSTVLNDLLDYEKYQNATKEVQRSIRNSIIQKLLSVSANLRTRTTSKYSLRFLTFLAGESIPCPDFGLQNNINTISTFGFGYTRSAYSVSFPDDFQYPFILVMYVREVLLTMHKDFCKNVQDQEQAMKETFASLLQAVKDKNWDSVLRMLLLNLPKDIFEKAMQEIFTNLLQAAKDKKWDNVYWMLQLNISIDYIQKKENGLSVLWYVAEDNEWDILARLIRKYPNIDVNTQPILEDGTNDNFLVQHKGKTPLWFAIKARQLNIIHLLLSKGAVCGTLEGIPESHSKAAFDLGVQYNLFKPMPFKPNAVTHKSSNISLRP